MILLISEPYPVFLNWVQTYQGPFVDLTIIQDFGIGMEEARSPELQSLTRYLTNAPGKGRTVGHIVLNVEKNRAFKLPLFSESCSTRKNCKVHRWKSFWQNSMK